MSKSSELSENLSFRYVLDVQINKPARARSGTSSAVLCQHSFRKIYFFASSSSTNIRNHDEHILTAENLKILTCGTSIETGSKSSEEQIYMAQPGIFSLDASVAAKYEPKLILRDPSNNKDDGRQLKSW